MNIEVPLCLHRNDATLHISDKTYLIEFIVLHADKLCKSVHANDTLQQLI